MDTYEVESFVEQLYGLGGGRGFQRHDDIDVAVIDIDIDMSVDVAGESRYRLSSTF